MLTEELFGIRLENGEISVKPRLPEAWRDRELHIEYRGRTLWRQNAPSEDNIKDFGGKN